jgi:hypothetical protein
MYTFVGAIAPFDLTRSYIKYFHKPVCKRDAISISGVRQGVDRPITDWDLPQEATVDRPKTEPHEQVWGRQVKATSGKHLGVWRKREAMARWSDDFGNDFVTARIPDSHNTVSAPARE